jgi:two-component system phosphate regulon sensor histidine kinase PhoR
MPSESTDQPILTAASEEAEPIEAMILRSMNEGVITLECSGAIHTVNPSAVRILGYEEQELKGKKLQEVFSNEPENRHFTEVILNAIERGLHTSNTETQFTRADGQTVDLAVATAYMDVDVCSPSLQNVVLVFRDVTAFRAMEKARRRAVNHLSHELKTPLAIIEATVKGLVRNDPSEEARNKAAERITRNLKRLTDMQEIVEQIISPPAFTPRHLQVDLTVQEIIEEIRTRCQYRAVRLTTRLQPIQSDAKDPELLSIVLNTLVKNAVEHTPDEGEVLISLQRKPEGILLQVQDYGVGIKVSDQEFIFDGFHYTQETDEYSTRKPFDFNAGGKGLELLHLKVLSEAGYFTISFKSERCRYIPNSAEHCPGRISLCEHVKDIQGCLESGGTTFTVIFPEPGTSEGDES